MYFPRCCYGAQQPAERVGCASERADRWFELGPKLGINCPKVGIGYFWYPSLGAKLRGAAATQNIMRGEEVCAVPVDQMLSEFSVGNSSLRDFMYAYAKGASATVSMILGCAALGGGVADGVFVGVAGAAFGGLLASFCLFVTWIHSSSLLCACSTST